MEELKFRPVFNFYKCTMCPYRTKSIFLLKHHTKRHRFTHTSKSFNCANSIEKFKCSKCDFRTAVLVNFNKHLEVSHQKVLEVKVEKPGAQANTLVFVNFNWINLVKSYSCESCDFKTYSQLFYIKHYTKCPLNVLANSTEKPNYHKFLQWHKQPKRLPTFKCPKCPFETTRVAVLKAHKQKHQPRRHLPPVPKTKRITLHLCPDCDFFAETATSLKNHILSKHARDEDVLWYKCDRCVFKTKWRANLYHHVKKMHCTTHYKCTECSYSSKQQRLLDAHIAMVHPTETTTLPSLASVAPTSPASKNLSCTKCDFKTTREAALSNHLYYKHTAIKSKWRRCEHCSYKTMLRKKMRDHMATKHPVLDEGSLMTTRSGVKAQEVKWLKCEICTYKSNSQKELKEHILEMHIVAESVICFNCQLCEFRTIDKEALKEHVSEVHINPQSSDWLQCDMCPSKFQNEVKLREHVLEKHIL